MPRIRLQSLYPRHGTSPRNPSDAPEPKLLDRAQQPTPFSPLELRSQTLAILFANRDTTAFLLSWTLLDRPTELWWCWRRVREA